VSLSLELVAVCWADDARRKARRYVADIASEWRQNWERKAACPQLWLGGLSAATPRTRERWVDQDAWPATRGELARRWIATSMAAVRDLYRKGSPLNPRKGSPRVPWRRDAAPLGDWCMVEGHFVGDGPRQGEWAVVDIERCHYSLLAAATIDGWFRIDDERAVYSPGRCELLRTDELDDNGIGKAASGMFARRSMEWLRYGERQIIPLSTFWSPDMTGLIHATVTAIAWDAVELFGARHVCCDAAIVPLDRAEEWQAFLAERWGLASRIEASGRGYLFGFNHWRIGGTSRNQQRRRPADEPSTSNLRPMTADLRSSLADLRRGLLTRNRHEAPWPAVGEMKEET